MKIEWRYIVAVVLLVFAWKGSALDLNWPPAPHTTITVPKPEPELLAWAEPLRPILPKMLLKDRQYLASFYDAMAFVLLRDAGRDKPIVGSTDSFASFHAGSLQMAIDKAAVGKYPGLGAAIDQTFINAIGADIRPLDKDTRTRLTAACGVLAWAFKVGGDG